MPNTWFPAIPLDVGGFGKSSGFERAHLRKTLEKIHDIFMTICIADNSNLSFFLLLLGRVRAASGIFNVKLVKFTMFSSDMEVSINGGTPKWMVYTGKSQSKMDDDWGTPIYGNPHISDALKAHWLCLAPVAPVLCADSSNRQNPVPA